MPYADTKAQREFQRRWVARRRAEWLAENGPCVECGSWNDLEIDHIDPSTKDPKLRSNGGGCAVWSWSQARREKELAKCQVLCGACHKQKTVVEHTKDVPHGTLTRYNKRGCRCLLCRAANNAYRTQHRAKIKHARVAQLVERAE